MDAVYILGLFGAIGLLFWLARRDNEIFRIEIRDGKATVERGRVPPAYLFDLRKITRNVTRGTVRAVKQDGQARIVGSSSIDEATMQRLRNAFSVHSASKI